MKIGVKHVIAEGELAPEPLHIEISSHTDWLKEARRLILTNNLEAAQLICEKRLGYTIKEFEVLMSKVIGDSPFSLSPSPTQDSILKSPQHVLKMSSKLFRQELSSYFKNPDKDMLWFMDTTCLDGMTLFERTLMDKDKSKILHDVMTKDFFPLQQFLHSCCRPRTQCEGELYHQDSGLGVMSRYASGLLILQKIGTQVVLQSDVSETFLDALFLNRTVQDDYWLNKTPFYMIGHMDGGLRYLTDLLNSNSERVAHAFSPYRLNKTMVSLGASYQDMNIFYSLMLNEIDGIHFLNELANKWLHYKVDIGILVPSIVSNHYLVLPHSFKPCADSILYMMVNEFEATKLLYTLLMASKQLGEKITADKLYKPYRSLKNSKDVLSHFYNLCEPKNPYGTMVLHHLFLNSPSLISEMSEEVLCKPYQDKLGWEFFSPFISLISTEQGKVLLDTLPEILNRVGVNSLIYMLNFSCPRRYHFSTLFRISECSNLILKLLELKPDLVRDIPFKEWFKLNMNYCEKDTYYTTFQQFWAKNQPQQITPLFAQKMKTISNKEVSEPISCASVMGATTPLTVMCQNTNGIEWLSQIDGLEKKLSALALSYRSKVKIDNHLGVNALYGLTLHSKGILLLKNIFQQQPELVSKLTFEAWTLTPKLFNGNSTQYFPLFLLLLKKQGFYLLDENPSILQWLTSDILNREVTTSDGKLTYSCLFILCSSQYSINLLKKTPNLLDNITKEGFLRRGIQNMSPFSLVCGFDEGCDLMLNSHLYQMINIKDLMVNTSSLKVFFDRKSIFFILLSHPKGRELLLKIFRHLGPGAIKLSTDFLCHRFYIDENQEHEINHFFLMCTSLEGIEILHEFPLILRNIPNQVFFEMYSEKLGIEPKATPLAMLGFYSNYKNIFLDLCLNRPNFCEEITVEALNTPIISGLDDDIFVSPFYFMVANPDNRQILNQFPKLLNKLYTKSLFQSIALKETDPRHFDTIFYYLSGIPSYRSITIDYLRQASDLEQYVTMDLLIGKVSCLHHLNILFNLCGCAAGIEILTIFIQKVPHIITGLTEQIGKGLITTIGETAITYSYLYLILSHEKGQEFLSKHPFLLKSLTVENLCRKITDQFPSIQPQGESSGLLMLSKQKIGHHLLLKMLQLYPQLFIHFPTEPIFESYHHAEGIISSYLSLTSTETGRNVLQLLAEKNDEIKTRLDSCFMGCEI